jgi:plastocyanin
LGALLALGAHAESAASESAAGVQIRNFAFVPAGLEVHVGETVTWENDDEEIHTIASRDGAFASPGLDGGERFSFRFEKPGTYEYGCGLHPQMKGTVVVR